MTDFNFLFLYLKKRNVLINKKEFIVQYESHPEYPSLLAVSDTLRFFNIDNGALYVDSSNISALPSFFMTKLKDTEDNSLAFVETQKIDDTYTIHADSKKHTVSKNTLIEKWKGIVFLVEDNIGKEYHRKQFTITHLLMLSCCFSFTLLFREYFLALPYFILFIIPMTGFTLSLLVLRNVFNFNSNTLNVVCNSNTSKSSDCDSVIDPSKKLSVLSDLSIVFFSYQLLTLLISGYTNTLYFYVGIQKVVLFISLPVLLFSIYYQIIRIKKLCPICISISVVVLIELVYILNLQEVISFQNIPFSHYNFQLFTFLILFIGWHSTKDILLSNRKMYTEIVHANRFKRNYTVFQNTLISTPRIIAPQTSLVFGNRQSNLTIDFVTSPYCGFCTKPYEMLRNLLEKHGENIAIRFVYNINFNNRSDESKQFLNHLVFIHQELGSNAFFEALDFWHQTKDHQKWLDKYEQIFDQEKIQNMLQSQRKWCIKNKITFTPSFFINGYQYPKMYKLEELLYFIDELIEDNIILQKAEVEKLTE